MAQPPASLTPPEGVAYRLEMPTPHDYLLEISLRTDDVRAPVRLVMPLWVPGSYLLREFPRNVQSFAAVDSVGKPLT